MKTLDEVIKAFEICIGYYCSNAEHDVCPYFGESDMGCMKEPEKDALRYLKEYRGLLKMWNDKLDKEQANPALTWSDLQQMDGKPVWVEPCKEWMLITEIETEPHIWLLSLDGMDYDMSLHEWQAYRKER